MSKCIGIVDSVSATEVKGYLLDSAPKSVSISGAGISLFPRINGFLLIPNETGSLVGIVTWIGYNHMRTDYDVNLPKGSRMLSMSILGHISHTLHGLSFERGTSALPTVGDQILLPDSAQLDCILNQNGDHCINIGTSPLTGNQTVYVPVNELFGRHLAILGNTGSGKSCTVAGLIRWSIEESEKNCEEGPNARFIILDPNGEYQNAFNNLNIDVVRCSIHDIEHDADQLRVPAWMWTSSEWASVFQASDKTQKPLLREALRTLRSAEQTNGNTENPLDRSYQLLHYIDSFLKVAISKQSFLTKEERGNFGKEFKGRIESLKLAIDNIPESETCKSEMEEFYENTVAVVDGKFKSFTNKNGENIEYYDFFDPKDIQQIEENVKNIISQRPHADDTRMISEDDPVEFSIDDMAPYIEDIASNTAAAQYIDFMTVRIRSMLRNSVLAPVIGNSPKVTLLDWITNYLGSNEDSRGKICIIDLSLIPTGIVHLLVAIIARLIFESLQRYRKYYGVELPTVLVMEEAHTFIHRYSEYDNSSDKLCTQIFEKIAREGRKYGLGLLVSSQRPAELSPTVLSQCNSFILHRIVNDKDQEMVRRLVPDSIGEILSELPVLPTKEAIVLGSAVQVPTLVEINELPEIQRPKSSTPDFWKIWTREERRNLDWKPIVNAWQKKVFHKSKDQ